jgi:hypothetical protein
MTCCKELEKALQPGTDNEAYDPLIYTLNEKYIMGYKLAPINYCPWCGAPFGQESNWSCLDPDHNHATKAEADACTANTDQSGPI